MTFPLIPQGRLIGLSFGTMRSFRRGSGSDVVGSRPYRLGDDVHAVDWAASARISAARQTDEFIVRERLAEEAPRVVVVADRRPSMSFFARPLPWLDKRAAARHAAELILQSSVLVGGFVGYLDHGDGEGDPYWFAPRGGRRLWQLREERFASAAFAAPDDTIEQALAHLEEHGRSVSAGSFVFVLSDFLAEPPDDVWRNAIDHGWDLVPVVIQDPTWEQSFPDVGGIALPLRDPETGRVTPVRLSARQAAARRAANEERLRALLAGFESLAIDPVVISSSDHVDVLAAFLGWSERRRGRRVA